MIQTRRLARSRRRHCDTQYSFDSGNTLDTWSSAHRCYRQASSCTGYFPKLPRSSFRRRNFVYMGSDTDTNEISAFTSIILSVKDASRIPEIHSAGHEKISARSLRGKGVTRRTIGRNFRSGAECITAAGTVPSSNLVTASGCAWPVDTSHTVYC